jgi:hypothetical protein
MAQERMDTPGRSARLVSMVLPILYWPPNAGRGPSTDKAVEGNAKTHQTDRTSLRAGRPDLPQAPKTGSSSLGLRQSAILNQQSHEWVIAAFPQQTRLPFWVIRVGLTFADCFRSSPIRRHHPTRPTLPKSANPAPTGLPLDNPVCYLGGDGMAEEWWSTISQRSPFLTQVKLYRGQAFRVAIRGAICSARRALS